jgi:predicted GNAT superfamily acetyltransferase
MAAAEPWDRALAAAASAGVELRALTSLGDADAILRVMIATWGAHQLLPREMIVALGESGNVPWGAFDGEGIVGYVLGWTGIDPEDGLHLHSHMLATLPDRRHRGVGYALKLAQRARCLDQGISIVRWTFDPLLSLNAHFNLAKLGAMADRLLPNFYGEMTDTLNRGERSDRLVVRWDLAVDPDGPAAEAGGFEVLGRRGDDVLLPMPTEVRPPMSALALIRIPREYHDLRERDRSLADDWRDAVARAFEACFDAGLVATGYTRDATYVLTEPA